MRAVAASVVGSGSLFPQNDWMAWLTAVIGVLAAFGGVLLGGFLTRRNERRAQGEHLLVDALNDAVSAIAKVAGGGQTAQRRYASAVARIALHSPEPCWEDSAPSRTRQPQERLRVEVSG